jgi:hypothetical protein
MCRVIPCGPARFSADIPQNPGLLSVIFRLIEARRNEIRSQLPLFKAKSSVARLAVPEFVALPSSRHTSAVAVCRI